MHMETAGLIYVPLKQFLCSTLVQHYPQIGRDDEDGQSQGNSKGKWLHLPEDVGNICPVAVIISNQRENINLNVFVFYFHFVF